MRPTIAAVVPIAVLLGLVPAGIAAAPVGIPLNCTHGPSDQTFRVAVTVPASVPAGSTYVVRVDGTNSGKISHTGLNYIFDMTYEYPVPNGAAYVEGSARIMPDTGTPNARPGARITHGNGVVTVVLPAHVEDGSSYTPPSFEFALRAGAPAGTVITQTFARYRVTANAFLVGDVKTTCDPKPRPFAVGVTRVEAAATTTRR